MLPKRIVMILAFVQHVLWCFMLITVVVNTCSPALLSCSEILAVLSLNSLLMKQCFLLLICHTAVDICGHCCTGCHQTNSLTVS